MKYNIKVNIHLSKDYTLREFKHYEIETLEGLLNFIRIVIPEKIDKAIEEDLYLRIYFKNEAKYEQNGK